MGKENIDIIERVHLEFLEVYFNLKSSAPSYMVFGETGHYPLYINIRVHVYTRKVSYWVKLFKCPENKIVFVL